jgi:hypothetical protein
MYVRSTRGILLVTAVVTLAACERKLTGPSPVVTAISPRAVCVGQVATEVSISGTGFSPLVSDGLLQSATVNLPAISLVHTRLLDGTAGSGSSLSIPDDAASGRVKWISSSSMTFQVYPDLALEPGLHTVRVENRNGQSGELAEALLAVPAPSLTSASPDVFCADTNTTLTLTGDFFIRSATAEPRILIAGQSLAPTSMANCRALPGNAGLEACTEMLFEVRAGSLATGEQTIQVINPESVGCSSSERKIYVAPAPAIAEIHPPGICVTATSAPVEVVGTGFLQVGSDLPTVNIGSGSYTPSAMGGCTAVSGLSQGLQHCTSLTVTVVAADLQSTNSATVANPAAAACVSSEAVGFDIVPLPVATSISPTKMCSAGGSVEVSGTNLRPDMVVELITGSTAVTASSVTVTQDGTTAHATFSGGLPVGTYDVRVTTGAGGCAATSTTQLTVADGPVVFFVDPPVIYNGITTQATVYASGFAGDSALVKIRLNGTSSETTVSSTFNALKDNRINFTLPAGTPAGSYDVIVSDATTVNCPGVLRNAITVVNQVTLALTAITPPFGYTGADSAVEITANATTAGGLQGLPRIYLNPTATSGTAIPLESVSLTDAGRATAVVPRTQSSYAGSYDLIVVNPNGAVGLLADAFQLVPDPLPVISTVSPGSMVTNTGSQPFIVTGTNFRDVTPALGVEYRCQSPDGETLTPVAATNIVLTGGTSITANIDTDVIPQGCTCVVRVTNADGTYADFSAVVFTNAAKKLTAYKAGPAMSLPRRALVTATGSATATAQFLYAIGGEDGEVVHDTVESVPLDLFGNPGAFSTQRYKLTVPRASATGKRVGRFIYVAGGRSDASTRLASVERAYILDPADRVELTDVDLAVVSAGLGGGLYYYRVAAVMGTSDPKNPGGENLPSDPFPIALPVLTGKAFELTLKWEPVSGATAYRVYRTVNPNDAAGSEQLLAEVSTTTYTDDGSATPSALTPLPIGSTGAWQLIGSGAGSVLSSVREGAASTVAADSAAPHMEYLYVVGGLGDSGVLGTVDVIAITTDPLTGGQTATVTPANAAGLTGRWLLGALTANSANSTSVTGSAQYVYALGGRTGTTLTSGVEIAEVLPGGVLGNWTSANSWGMSPTRAGFGHVLANNRLFAMGGTHGTPSADCSSAQIDAPPPGLTNWQNSTATMAEQRYLVSTVLHGSLFIYLVGGQTNTSSATRSVEQVVW